MSRDEGESLLRGLIGEVLARLGEHGFRDTGAQIRWRRVEESIAAGEGIFCEAAGALGIDPYRIDERSAEFIEACEGLFERDTLVDFVSGAARVDRNRLLGWVDRMVRDRSSKYRVPELGNIVRETVRKTPGQEPRTEAWAMGYRRARVMRHVLGLGQEKRFKTFRDIANLLGAHRSYELAPNVDGIRALRTERPDGIQIHLRNHGDSAEATTQHLFAITRALGDAACFPGHAVAPINDVHNAYRQAAGRAFAAEFLAPISEVRSMLDDQHDVVSIANEFAVSTNVIERQIENAKRIDAATA